MTAGRRHPTDTRNLVPEEIGARARAAAFDRFGVGWGARRRHRAHSYGAASGSPKSMIRWAAAAEASSFCDGPANREGLGGIVGARLHHATRGDCAAIAGVRCELSEFINVGSRQARYLGRAHRAGSVDWGAVVTKREAARRAESWPKFVGPVAATRSNVGGSRAARPVVLPLAVQGLGTVGKAEASATQELRRIVR